MLAKTDINTLINDRTYVEGWLEAQPQDKIYDYTYSTRCAFAQFLMQHGAEPTEFYKEQGCCVPPGFWELVVHGAKARSTFGEALARLRRHLNGDTHVSKD